MIDCNILPKIAKSFDLNETMLQIGEIFICKYEFTSPGACDSHDQIGIEERDVATFGSGKSASTTQTGLGAHKDGTPWSFVHLFERSRFGLSWRRNALYVRQVNLSGH